MSRRRSLSFVIAGLAALACQAERSIVGPEGEPGNTLEAPATFIEITPAAWTAEAGDSVHLSAVVRNVHGEMTGSAITWSSSNQDVVHINATGQAVASRSGTASIRATTGQVSKSIPVTVKAGAPPPPAKPAWPNAPASWNVLSDEPGNAPVPAIKDGPWTNQWNIGDNAQGYVSTVADATGPHSPGSVIQYRYPAGFQGGVGPGKVYRGLGATRMYAGFWWKVSNPWQGHVTGSNKVAYVMTNGNGSMTLVMREQNGRYEMWMYPQFSTSSAVWLGPNVNNPAVTLGEWHQVEWIVEYTPGGGGRIQWWLDGKLVGDYSNQRFPNEALADFRLSAIWGGVGDVKRQTDYYWYDHVHIRTP